jgi:hypothetical protein
MLTLEMLLEKAGEVEECEWCCWWWRRMRQRRQRRQRRRRRRRMKDVKMGRVGPFGPFKMDLGAGLARGTGGPRYGKCLLMNTNFYKAWES